jgi:hypothetical protein
MSSVGIRASGIISAIKSHEYKDDITHF